MVSLTVVHISMGYGLQFTVVKILQLSLSNEFTQDCSSRCLADSITRYLRAQDGDMNIHLDSMETALCILHRPFLVCGTRGNEAIANIMCQNLGHNIMCTICCCQLLFLFKVSNNKYKYMYSKTSFEMSLSRIDMLL